MKTRKRKKQQTNNIAEAMEEHLKDGEFDSAVQRFSNITVKRKNILGTGSTLLNLSCSNNPFGGFLKGHYYWLVGDSKSGKTFLSMTCFAEAVCNPAFKHYRLIYDNKEDGCLMDVERLFGKRVAEKIEPPAKDGDLSVASRTIEEFYYNVDDALQDGRPFIYVLDSMDSVSSDQDQEKFQAHKRVHRGVGKRGDDAGSYGAAKAKANSTGLREVISGLSESESILIIISQTRDNLKGRAAKTVSGGRALKFYATTEIWSSVIGKITKTVQGHTRSIGTEIEVKAKKNRITGLERDVILQIYPSYGIDDIGSCIDWMVDEKLWKMKKQSIVAEEFGITATKQKLISEIESNGLENEFRQLVGKRWNEIEEMVSLQRKKRYE
jgi:RecA/RadA recombinase